MRIIHRVSLHSSHTVRESLSCIGISVPDSGMVTFEIGEDDVRWPRYREMSAAWDVADLPRAQYDRSEIEMASHLEMVATTHWGFPQPRQDEFGYLAATYDLREHCDNCGVGAVQTRPFQLKRVPGGVSTRVLQLNWVYDVFFVKVGSVSRVLEELGVALGDVLDTKGAVLSGLRQMLVRDVVRVCEPNGDNLVCDVCGRGKLQGTGVWRSQCIERRPQGHVALTDRWFGNGSEAHHRTIVSADLRRALESVRARGVEFQPVRVK